MNGKVTAKPQNLINDGVTSNFNFEIPSSSKSNLSSSQSGKLFVGSLKINFEMNTPPPSGGKMVFCIFLLFSLPPSPPRQNLCHSSLNFGAQFPHAMSELIAMNFII